MKHLLIAALLLTGCQIAPRRKGALPDLARTLGVYLDVEAQHTDRLWPRAGLFVLEVFQSSAADLSGIRRGDILLTRGWFPDSRNRQVVSIYEAAGKPLNVPAPAKK